MAYTSTGVAYQGGREVTYGTAVTPTFIINAIGGSVTPKTKRYSENTFLASKAKTTSDLTAVSVEGNIDFILSPESAGEMIKWAFGGTDTTTPNSPVTGATLHTIVLQDALSAMPSRTIVIDRKVGVMKYSGVKVDSFSLNAQTGDVVKGSVAFKGKDESSGATASLTALALKNFKLTNASLTIGGVSIPAKSVKFNLKNNLQEVPQNITSGLYLPEPVHGVRDITFDVETEYSTAIETLKSTNMVTDTLVTTLVFTFQSPSFITGTSPYKITITANNLTVDEISDPVGSPGSVMMSTLKMSALQISGVEPVTAAVNDAQATAY